MTWNRRHLEAWRMSLAWLGIFFMFTAGWHQSTLLAAAACFAGIMSNQAAILWSRCDE